MQLLAASEKIVVDYQDDNEAQYKSQERRPTAEQVPQPVLDCQSSLPPQVAGEDKQRDRNREYAIAKTSILVVSLAPLQRPPSNYFLLMQASCICDFMFVVALLTRIHRTVLE